VEDIIVVENFIPAFYQKSIAEKLSSHDFPWYYGDNTSGEPQIPVIGTKTPISDMQYGFFHMIFHNEMGGPLSNNYMLMRPMISAIEEYLRQPIDVLRIRAGMTVSEKSPALIHGHVDFYEPHTTILYYVNDSDGDTVFYEEIYDGEEKKNLNFMLSNPPKRGSIVIFNGLRYHSTTKPIVSPRRMTININIDNIIF
jgi:hypothetical protein